MREREIDVSIYWFTSQMTTVTRAGPGAPLGSPMWVVGPRVRGPSLAGSWLGGVNQHPDRWWWSGSLTCGITTPASVLYFLKLLF